MKKYYRLEQALLLLFIIVGGIEVGGGLYEIRVIQPLILHSQPESVWKFSLLRTQYPEFAINPGFKFWKFTSPFILISAIGLLILSFKTNKIQQRFFLLISTLLIICFVTTLFYFAPTTGKIMDSAKLKLNAEETTSIVLMWTRLNWLRLVFYMTAWLTALKTWRENKL
ncbi:DUF1772 domain-containing protein [Emticicia sp. W12TSBA100-4]|uniref:DUF1772 domain-containing protein n=1 Tax=Emticicia sp. W12TSBA100-4 TaxID=3160965 RepID=UPI003305BCE3